MAPNNRLELGDYIKQARERKGLSIRALGRETGIEASAISRIERGETIPRFTPDRLAKIGNALDVDVSELYTMAGYPVNDSLPELALYLKTKYKLPEGAVDEMANYLKVVETKYEVSEDGSD